MNGAWLEDGEMGSLPPGGQVEGFRLSPQQERLWSLALASPGAAWTARAVVALEGPLVPADLERAVRRTVERHEILRTTFRSVPGMALPLQVLAGPGLAWGGWHDLSGLPAAERRARIDALAERLASASPPLEAGPLFRAEPVRLGPDGHALVLALPALCADAPGLANLVEEIARAYAVCRGEAGEGEEPVQYVDAAELLRTLAGSEEGEAGRAYWRGMDAAAFDGWRAALGLQAAPEAGGFEPRARPVGIEPGLAERLERRAGERGVPLETLLFAAWTLLLSRLSGNPEAGAALASAGRKYEGLEGALGLFARFLPVRLEIPPDEPFASLLARVEEEVLRGRRVEDYHAWEAPRFPGWACEIVREPAAVEAGGVAFRLVRREVVTERFAVLLAGRRSPGGLDLEIRYDAAALPGLAAGRLASGLRALLESVAACPEARVGELAILEPAERHQVVREWNDTAADLGRGSLHGLFAEQAERTPDRVAVEGEDGRLTYAGLAREASRLARLLARRGVGAESVVGICLERSPEMLVALLGVLEAGAAWLPLDPDLPPGRLAAMVEDAAPVLVITEGRLSPALSGVRAETLDLAASREPLAGEEPGEFRAAAPPEQLAYLLYTSGSTGRPKGVLVSHGAIRNRLAWMQRDFPLGAGDRVLQKTPLGFDASIWELFAPLAAGATVVMARPGGHQDPAYLVRAVREREITVLQLVPSVLRLVLDEPELPACTGLRRLFCGGEALTDALRERFHALLPEAELHNLYGPTEAAIDAACEPRARPGGAGAPGIGRPLANVRVLLLDAAFGPVPAGRPGEISVGGAGLARGYLGRPDLTAERFVPDPLADEPGARLYRTGDLGRHRPGGVLEYLGRLDHQLKIGGVRIEPAEVEAALARHPGVRQAVVGEWRPGNGEVRLVAHVVAAGDPAPSAAELRRFLAARLPDPMLPSAFVLVPDLPRLVNGKVDRRALPPPEARAAERPYAPPRSAMETLVTAVWAEVLGAGRVGRDDSFFELGGSSLGVTQVFSRLRRTLPMELPMRSLFEAPVAAAFAARLEAMRRSAEGLAQVPPIRPVPRAGRLPLSFAQQRLWFLEQWEPGRALFHIAAALTARGPLDGAALTGAWRELLRRHESLRTTFEAVDGEPAQEVRPPGAGTIPGIDLSALPEEARAAELSRLLAAEVRRPFDLAAGPLVRLELLRLGSGETVMLLVLHHIVGDAWSMNVLVREIAELYRAAVAGRPAALPEPELQYADFAGWQRQWLSGDVLSALAAYWLERMAGAPPVLDLPADRPRQADSARRGARLRWRLPADRLEALRSLGLREGATLFMVFLSAFEVLLHHLTGRTDLVVGTDIANRNRVETEGLIGFLVNQLPLRLDVSGDPAFRELLGRTREVVLGAYIHQDLPFDHLVEALNPVRSLLYAPVFQVKLNFHNVPQASLDLPGVTLEPRELPREIAQLDLIWNLLESGQGLEGSVEHDAHLFDGGRVRGWIDRYERILAAVAADPDLRVSALSDAPDLADVKARAFETARRRSIGS